MTSNVIENDSSETNNEPEIVPNNSIDENFN